MFSIRKIPLLLLIFFLLVFPFFLQAEEGKKKYEILFPEQEVYVPEEILLGIPDLSDLLISRKGFTFAYSFRYRQAIWVAYILTAENLQKKQKKRRNSFRKDPVIRFSPVLPKDYRKTGYDKGHLAPAADMTYSAQSMKNSFFMTNISPQSPGCNRGIWKRVEKEIRKWALKEKRLCVITGPVFRNTGKKLGNTSIPIPTAFYKVVLDMTPPVKMIAFLVPNAPSRRRIDFFCVSVDKVEEVTGYDFFSTLPDDLENKLEKECNIFLWRHPEKLNNRINQKTLYRSSISK